MREGGVRPIALLEQQARPFGVPHDVRAIRDHAVRRGECGAQREVAADVMVDGGARIGAHVDRGDEPALALEVHRLRGRHAALPRRLDARVVQPQHHADVEQRLVAHRAAAEQVLDRLLVAIGGVGELGLGELLLDHRGADQGERRIAVRARLVLTHRLTRRSLVERETTGGCRSGANGKAQGGFPRSG